MKVSAAFLRSIAFTALVGFAAACGDDDPTGPGTPATPTGLTAVRQTDGSILGYWTAVNGATGYKLERTEGASGTFTQVGSTLTTPTYTDAAVQPSVDYGYRVSAVNSAGESAASATVTA